MIKLVLLILLNTYAYGIIFKLIPNYDVNSNFEDFLISSRVLSQYSANKQKLDCLSDCSFRDECQSISLVHSNNTYSCNLFNVIPIISDDLDISTNASVYIKLGNIIFKNSLPSVW